AMSAAIASRRRPSRIASAIRGSSSTSSTRTLRSKQPVDIVGVSKIAYVLATRRWLKWRRDLQRASTNDIPSYIDRSLPSALAVRHEPNAAASPREDDA